MASGPVILWQINGEEIERVADFIFLGCKITADGDCSHEIKTCLLLGRKTMKNLDSILKSRDITLLTKAMFFPVITYGCESWTIRRLSTKEFMLSNCGSRFLWVLWMAGRSNQSVLKEINPEYLLEGLMLKLKLQYFGHLMWRAGSLEKTLRRGKIEGGRRRGRQRMRCLDGITNTMDINLSKFQEIVKDGKA